MTARGHPRQVVEPPFDHADIVAGDVDDDLELGAGMDCCALPTPHTATAEVQIAASHARAGAADAVAMYWGPTRAQVAAMGAKESSLLLTAPTLWLEMWMTTLISVHARTAAPRQHPTRRRP